MDGIGAGVTDIGMGGIRTWQVYGGGGGKMIGASASIVRGKPHRHIIQTNESLN